MSISCPPFRDFIQQTFKDFPWSYCDQGDILMAYADLLLAGRTKSWSSYTRLGIEDFTVKKFQYALLNGEVHIQFLKEGVVSQFGKIDKRETFNIATDDTNSKRYGKKIFAASINYDHANKGFQYGNILVDYSVSSLSYLDNGYEVYLSKKSLIKEVGSDTDLETKIELAKKIFNEQVRTLLNLGVSAKQIYCTSDSWFGCKTLTDLIRELGVNFIFGIKKSATCNLFGKGINLEKLFKDDGPWKLKTSPNSENKVFYQQKIINMTTMGKCKVFAIKRGQEKRIRYYITNKLNLTIGTFLRKWKIHWNVEILHDNIKNYMGLDHCYSGREIINCSHWNFVYLLNLLFKYFQLNLEKKGQKFTIFQLWELYCIDYDIIKAKKSYRSEKQIAKAKKRLVTGWC